MAKNIAMVCDGTERRYRKLTAASIPPIYTDHDHFSPCAKLNPSVHLRPLRSCVTIGWQKNQNSVLGSNDRAVSGRGSGNRGSQRVLLRRRPRVEISDYGLGRSHLPIGCSDEGFLDLAPVARERFIACLTGTHV